MYFFIRKTSENSQEGVILINEITIFSDVKLRENEAKVTTLSEEADGVGEKGDVILSAEDKALIKTLSDEKESLPDYDPDAETLVAENFVVPQSGYYCKVCKIFLLTDEVIDVHCRYFLFIKNKRNVGLTISLNLLGR